MRPASGTPAAVSKSSEAGIFARRGFRDDRIVGKCAERVLRDAGEDPVADREAGCTFAERLDDAGQVVAHHRGQAVALDDLQHALADFEIDGIESRRFHPHQNLVRAGARLRHLAQFGCFGAAIFGQNKRSHGHHYA
ncbi:hypothetical protein Sj15T_10350 [Sphingobium sp. TA15]|nr:hypothetical protein Sj15T_10350 [Sphingobium sp. TA15]